MLFWIIEIQTVCHKKILRTNMNQIWVWKISNVSGNTCLKFYSKTLIYQFGICRRHLWIMFVRIDNIMLIRGTVTSKRCYLQFSGVIAVDCFNGKYKKVRKTNSNNIWWALTKILAQNKHIILYNTFSLFLLSRQI